MSNHKSTSKEEAFEIIELATNDIETLANAFDLIARLCSNSTEEEPRPEAPILH